MARPRVIPALLLDGGRLVKTKRFARPVYVGDPINVSRLFNDKGVDELLVLDIGVSRRRAGIDFATIEQLASECFMPLAYGGGIASVDDAHRLVDCGVEKLVIQRAAELDITFLTRLAARFGEQAVVASVDLTRDLFGRRSVRSTRASGRSNPDWVNRLRDLCAAGAGEIVLTTIDREGTMSGMDLDVIRTASKAVTVPLIASGGVGSLADVQAAFTAGASAVAVGSFAVFQGPHRAVLISYPSEAEMAGLRASGEPT